MTEKQKAQLFLEAQELETQMRGDELENPFIVLMRICRDYMEMSQGLTGVYLQRQREELIARLDKFRVKYFEKI